MTIIFQIWAEYLVRSGKSMVELKAKISGKSPYKYVILWNNGKYKNYNVHRLVALHFIPNPRMIKCVDHIDGDKYNNKASNLRWVTYSENRLNPNTAWKCEKPVARFTIDGKYVDERASIQAYVEEFGFNGSHITSCCQGKRKSHKGYKFMYLDKQGYLPY